MILNVAAKGGQFSPYKPQCIGTLCSRCFFHHRTWHIGDAKLMLNEYVQKSGK